MIGYIHETDLFAVDINEELNYALSIIDEARKLNPEIGYYPERISQPLSSKGFEARLTNGTIKIGWLTLHEFKRSGKKKTPRSFIQEVADSFEPAKPV